MRIVLIRKNYTSYGGAESYLNLVSDGLRAQGHKVHIFSASDWQGSPFQIHKINAVKKPSFLSNIFFALNVKNELKKDSFDCILSFERIFFPVRKKALSGLSNWVYRAGDGCHREWLNRRKIAEPFFKKLSFALNPHHLTLLYLEKRCFSDSKTIIANSMMVKKDIMQHYPEAKDKIHIIYNGVDLERFHPVGKEQKTIIRNSFDLKKQKIILFVGADFKRKGLDTLFKAFSLLDIRDKKLIIAGRPAKKCHISMAKKLGIDKNVIFRGAEKEIEKLYSVADVFVLPTIYDPFSNATLEAMASGLPVITTAYNGASELIEDGIEGFVMNNPLDADAIAQKISTTLQQAEDMGKKARLRAEGYSVKKAVDEIIKVISVHSR